MRPLLSFLLLILMAAPAGAQLRPLESAPPQAAEEVQAENAGAPADHDPEVTKATPEPDMAGADFPASSVAQPTLGGFLYQVFLAAVTALVTALIWKAVF